MNIFFIFLFNFAMKHSDVLANKEMREQLEECDKLPVYQHDGNDVSQALLRRNFELMEQEKGRAKSGIFETSSNMFVDQRSKNDLPSATSCFSDEEVSKRRLMADESKSKESIYKYRLRAEELKKWLELGSREDEWTNRVLSGKNQNDPKKTSSTGFGINSVFTKNTANVNYPTASCENQKRLNESSKSSVVYDVVGSARSSAAAAA